MQERVMLFLDDVRELDMIKPFCIDDEQWEWEKSHYKIARTMEEAIEILNKYDVVYATLDHDLGVDPKAGKLRPDGMDLCKWMSENHKWPPYVDFYTGNVIAKGDMISLANSYIKVFPESQLAKGRNNEIDHCHDMLLDWEDWKKENQ